MSQIWHTLPADGMEGRRSVRKLFFIVVVFLIACAEPGGSQKATPPMKLGASVEVSGGTITGNVREDGLHEYLGIPYAAPPVGDRRWQPPGAVMGWEGTRDATKRGLPCMQPGSLSEFYDRSYLETSEDCLTLNVWTRADTVAQGLPVMVWIHGGALVMGSGRDYDGAPLTGRGVVLVTINYRLGPFGFYAHPELSAENPAGASGNQGFRDQIAALQWVKDNIAAFGGNPDNVTIFGESAGSWSMSVMQASPMARGLFHKVIGQSGARFIPIPDLQASRWGLPSAESWGETLAQKFTGKEAASLADLRAVDAQAIMDIYSADPVILNNFDYLTIEDGEVLPQEVNAIFAAGAQADVPVLIGSNADEATTFDPAVLDPNSVDLDYGDALKSQVQAMLPAANERLFDVYPPTAEAGRQSWIEFSTDAMFTQPMRLWADYMELVSSPAYLYWWEWRPVIDGSDQYGAFHAAEIPYVFGDLGMFDIEPSADESAFSDLMMTIWTNFAKTGNPSVANVIDWPAYATTTPSTAVLGRDLSIRQGIRSERVEMITAAYDAHRKP